MGLSNYAEAPELDLLELDSAMLNALLQRYLLENLRFTSNKEVLHLHYLGSQKKDDGMWCFLEYENLSPFDEIVVFNSLLINAFEDQENLVHFRKNKIVKSLRLNHKNKIGTVNWYP
jgi:hypothetical protein